LALLLEDRGKDGIVRGGGGNIGCMEFPADCRWPIPVLVLTTGRPLWRPARFTSQQKTSIQDNGQSRAGLTVYSVYATRLGRIPLAAGPGLFERMSRYWFLAPGGEDPTSFLWRPFGRKRVRTPLGTTDSAFSGGKYRHDGGIEYGCRPVELIVFLKRTTLRGLGNEALGADSSRTTPQCQAAKVSG